MKKLQLLILKIAMSQIFLKLKKLIYYQEDINLLIKN